MSAHTPGPWVVERPETGGVYASGRMVASVYGDHPACKRDTRQDANCHLIAAAPDLLEALKSLVERIDINGGIGEYQGGPAFVMDLARKAIAKAEGRS